MVDILLEEVSIELNDYFNSKSNTSIFRSVVGDISTHDKPSDGGNENDISNSIVVTLISIEEESVMKNNYPMRTEGSSTIKEKSYLYINVYILFSANFSVYDQGLKLISRVISFFQTKKKVSFVVDEEAFEAIFNLYNIGFENLNNLWTVLGGRYLPSVIYKARILKYQASPPAIGPAIIEIQETEK